jgi:hypothetical protein
MRQTSDKITSKTNEVTRERFPVVCRASRLTAVFFSTGTAGRLVEIIKGAGPNYNPAGCTAV